MVAFVRRWPRAVAWMVCVLYAAGVAYQWQYHVVPRVPWAPWW